MLVCQQICHDPEGRREVLLAVQVPETTQKAFFYIKYVIKQCKTVLIFLGFCTNLLCWYANEVVLTPKVAGRSFWRSRSPDPPRKCFFGTKYVIKQCKTVLISLGFCTNLLCWYANKSVITQKVAGRSFLWSRSRKLLRKHFFT